VLPGFFIQTKPLSEIEKEMLPHIASGLSKMKGASNAISNKEIGEKLFIKRNVKLSDARIRKIINHIRMNNIVPGLVANGCGYYVTNNIIELKEYYKSLEGREMAINAVKMKLKEHITALERTQQHHFNYSQ
jgi:hypothetical protein